MRHPTQEVFPFCAAQKKICPNSPNEIGSAPTSSPKFRHVSAACSCSSEIGPQPLRVPARCHVSKICKLALRPPSITIVVPVIKPARGLHKKTQRLPMSWGVPIRRSGWIPSTCAQRFAEGSGYIAEPLIFIGVSINPGAMPTRGYAVPFQRGRIAPFPTSPLWQRCMETRSQPCDN